MTTSLPAPDPLDILSLASRLPGADSSAPAAIDAALAATSLGAEASNPSLASPAAAGGSLLQRLGHRLFGQTGGPSAAGTPPPWPAPLIAEADAARDGRDWPLAAKLYAQALSTQTLPPASTPADEQRMPPLWPIWVQLGHARKESGDLVAAEAAYLLALRLEPAEADSWLQLGHLLKITGRAGLAARAYLRALRLAPGEPHAQRELEDLLATDIPAVTYALAPELASAELPGAESTSDRLPPHLAAALHGSLLRLALRGAEPQAVVAASPALRHRLVDDLFRATLGRRPNPGALAYYEGTLGRTMAVYDVLQELLHGDEFRARNAGADPYEAMCDLAEEIEARLAGKLALPALAEFERRERGSSQELAAALRQSLMALMDA